MQIYQMDILPRTIGLNWITGFSTITFAYACHPVFFYLRGELRSKSTRRVRKVISFSIVTETILYVSIAVAGYLSLGNNMVPDVYFLRKPIRKKTNRNPRKNPNFFILLNSLKNNFPRIFTHLLSLWLIITNFFNF